MSASAFSKEMKVFEDDLWAFWNAYSCLSLPYLGIKHKYFRCGINFQIETAIEACNE